MARHSKKRKHARKGKRSHSSGKSLGKYKVPSRGSNY
jgi:hypothetical protein